MNKYKTLLAVSAITLVSVNASAAIYNYNIVMTGETIIDSALPGVLPDTVAGNSFAWDVDTVVTGNAVNFLTSVATTDIVAPASTATYDDVTGLLTMSVSWFTTAGVLRADTDIIDISAGSTDTGLSSWSNCWNIDGSPGCSFATASFEGVGQINFGLDLGSLVASDPATSIAFTSITGSGSAQDPRTTENWVLTANVSAVPVPAAAWLFGSALVGLAGVGRKRNAS
jgi:hypothetical protein